MSIYFTSDLHFGHANIIKYCKRPFFDSFEMDEQLIANWNRVVGPDDLVYNLGDFFLCEEKYATSILNRLNGKIYCLNGNHERTLHELYYKIKPYCIDKIGWVKDYFELRVPDSQGPKGTNTLVLLHYALRVWNKSHHGAYHLYGHSHGGLPDDNTSLSFDCGIDSIAMIMQKRKGASSVDPADYAPVSYDFVKSVMATKKFVPIDHHGRESDGKHS